MGDLMSERSTDRMLRGIWVAITALIGGSSCATSQETTHFECTIVSDFERRATVADFINSADSIATYTVVSATRLNSEMERYQYQLTLNLPISGSPQSRISVEGRAPHAQLPEHYFGLLRSYSSIQPDERIRFGSAIRGVSSSGECAYLPKFFVGYSYVVVSGPEMTRASYAPALNINQNEWITTIYSVLSEGGGEKTSP